jgi:C-terminal processing protease CtpA/Prc
MGARCCSRTSAISPKNAAIHEKGLAPDIEVDQPDVEFGTEPPAGDVTLDKALERLATKKAA